MGYFDKPPMIINVNSGLTQTQLNQAAKNIVVPYNYQGAVITLIDDDGTLSFYNQTKAIYDAKGVKASLSIITDKVGQDEYYMTLDQLKVLEANGFEIISHTKTHSPTIFNKAQVDLSTIPDATFDDEFRLSQQWIQNNGFANSDVITYPYGAFGAQAVRIKRLARKYYKYALDTWGDNNTSPVDNMYLKRHCLTVTEDFTTVLKPIIDAVISSNGWLILYHHSDDATNFSTTYLNTVIDYIKSKNVPILPFGQAVQYKGNAFSIGEYTDPSKKFYVGMDGETLSGSGSFLNMVPYSNTLTMDDTPTNYSVGITVKQINGNKDTLTYNGGDLITYKGDNDDFIFQFFTPYNSNVLYLRHWNTSNNNWLSWTLQTALNSAVIHNSGVHRYATDTITVFTKGQITWDDIGAGSATGFPNNASGELITYRSANDDLFSYQEYHLRQSNSVYKRYCDVNNAYAWTAWTKISVV